MGTRYKIFLAFPVLAPGAPRFRGFRCAFRADFAHATAHTVMPGPDRASLFPLIPGHDLGFTAIAPVKIVQNSLRFHTYFYR